MATPAELMEDARCIDICIPDGMKLAVLIKVFAENAGMSADPATLMAESRCIANCIPAGMQLSVLVYLANQILENGGGGSGGFTCSAADPVAAPSGSCGYHINTATGSSFYWDGAAWQPQITM